MIEVLNLWQVFEQRTVLHGVNFEVPKGAIYGFIGPNGAGKTTTIRVMTTLLTPTHGTVRIAGRDVVEDPQAVRAVMGYMPDLSGAYQRITAVEYLEFFAAAQGIPLERRARTVQNVIELADLGQLRDREVAAMSKGQKQRMLLARTLLHDPQVLILDEPASDLDPRARIEMRLLLQELGRMGKTILLSSHILTELADVCTWVGIIERGHMVVSGPLSEVQTQMRPGQRVRFKLLSRGPEAESLLRAMPSVKQLQFIPSETTAATPTAEQPASLEVTYEGQDDQIAELVFRLAEARIPILAVEPERHDLERIFMDVTAGARSSSPPEGKA